MSAEQEVEGYIEAVEYGTVVRDYADNIVSYAISADLWRELRALLRRLAAPRPQFSPGEAEERYLEILERMNPSPEVLAVIERIRTEGR